MGASTCRRSHGTAAEVVASVDVNVPMAVGDVAHVHLLTFGFPIKGAALCHSILCVFSVLLLILSIVFFWDTKARKLCSSNKKRLAQPDEAWVKTLSLRCFLVPCHSFVFSTSYILIFFTCRNT